MNNTERLYGLTLKNYPFAQSEAVGDINGPKYLTQMSDLQQISHEQVF